MTMHLVGPHMTTTKYHRKKSSKKTARQLEAERQHLEFLKKMGVDDESLRQKLPHDKKGRRQGICEMPNLSTGPRRTSDRVAGHGVAKDRKTYTGNELLGIATMHKSNAVPIRKDSPEAAKDIAAMRR